MNITMNALRAFNSIVCWTAYLYPSTNNEDIDALQRSAMQKAFLYHKIIMDDQSWTWSAGPVRIQDTQLIITVFQNILVF